PDSATTITVRGIQALPALVNDTDAPAAPARYHEAIALRAAILLCYVVGTRETAEALLRREAEYVRIVDSCKQYLAGEQNAGFVRRVRRPLPERINLGGIGEYGG
ncbi:MAG TPA: hypothetical protein VGS41_12705, partial [Chthonomonadales bacterium]|nr:hypothetical protein [Chthonomonadales bacterium]